MPIITGACFCGRCRYEARSALYDVLHCHCTDCRKITGSAFSTYAGVYLANFKWLSEIVNLKEYKTSERVTRFMCSTCGSLIASFDRGEKDMIYLSVGLIDTEIEISVEYHQFVSSKVPWFEIDDGLPQFKWEA